MNILISGGAGFIGSTLAERFVRRGDHVTVIDNFSDYYDPQQKEDNVKWLLTQNSFSLVRKDILDFEALSDCFQKGHFDLVVHLAARAGVRPSLIDPIAYQKTNGEGTVNILECARRYGVHNLILASSSSVYGNNQKMPFSETDCVDFAISPYAATKKANEVMAYVYHSAFNLNILMFRFFTVYGPRQRPDLAINKFVRSIDAGAPIDIYGTGKSFRDYTYIDDICQGVEEGAAYLKDHEHVYEIINLGSNRPITLLQMVQTIEKVLGKKAVLHFLPMQVGDVNATYADISKAKKLLGYAPSISFEEGIKRFISWYFGTKKH